MRTPRSISIVAALGALSLALAGCGGSTAATPTPSPAPTATATAAPTASPTAAPTTAPTAVPTASPTAPPVATPTATATSAPTATAAPTTLESPTSAPTLIIGPASVAGPATAEVGTYVTVDWTGPNNPSDYITMVAAGTTVWTNETYAYTTGGTPLRLIAPGTPGAYEIWYANADNSVAARTPITLTPFVGTIDGPDSVEAGSSFTVDWTGPNGPQDYVTIVPVGTTEWTNESYFDTSGGTPGTLVAPLDAGDYELWYVRDQDHTTMVTQPITVTPYVVTLKAPDRVAAGSTFEVKWTGPNGPTDYITIVPAGAPDTDYLSYAYTASGGTVTLTAPTDPGDYEIRYASDRVDIVFGSTPIVVH